MWRATFVLACLTFVTVASASDKEPGVRIVPPGEATAATRLTRATNNEIRRLLSKRLDVDFDKAPMKEVLAFLKQAASVPSLRIDENALTEEGIDVNIEVSLKATGVTLGQALHRILSPLALTWRVKDESLIITTEVKEEQLLVLRSYPVKRLAAAVKQAAKERQDSSDGRFGAATNFPSPETELGQFVETLTAGPWMNRQGTGGTASEMGQSLLVRNREKVHDEVAGLLNALNLFLDAQFENGAAEVHSSWSPAEDESSLQESLARRIPKVDFAETPLVDVVAFLREAATVRITIDEIALSEEGVSLDQPVTFDGVDKTLRSLSHLMLEPLGLTMVTDHGFLKVTTIVHAEEEQRLMVFDVRDLTAAGLWAQSIIDTLMFETTGPWSESDGTGGNLLSPLPGCLVVRQTEETLREIAVLLDDVRRDLLKAAETGEPVVNKVAETAAELDRVETRFYPIVRKGMAEQLAETLPTFVAEESWKSKGAALRVVDGTLVIRQSNRVHRDIQKFLKSLKDAEDAPTN